MAVIPLDTTRLPAVLGDCYYCGLTLWDDAPIVKFPDGAISHVACETDARRRASTSDRIWPRAA